MGAAEMVPYSRAAAAATQLQTWYNGRSYRAHWWESAIALSTVISYMRSSGTSTYLSNLADTYQAFHNTNDFTRNYYDDEGWWVLAWAQAYQLTGQKQYLREAEHIFAAMASGWSSTCGGGVPWSKHNLYKNAITNELFLDGAATLHNLIPGDHVYARWALREWQWFKASGMLTRKNLVVDGLTAGCVPVPNSPLWTYNQGVLIGALIQLSGVTGSKALIAQARRVAVAVMTSPTLSPKGILTEPCPPLDCGTDSQIFKGVMAQNLGFLQEVAPDPAVQAYLTANAASLWANDRSGNAFGVVWSGPFLGEGAGQQVAALALLSTQIPGGA